MNFIERFGQARRSFVSIAEEARDRLQAKGVEPAPVLIDLVCSLFDTRDASASLRRGRERLPVAGAVTKAFFFGWIDTVRAPWVVGTEMITVALQRARQRQS